MSQAGDVTKSNRKFPCSDGTTVVLPFFAAYTLARVGIRKIRVVAANGKKYYYVQWPGEPEQSLTRWLILEHYQLHRKLDGQGRIHHDGSDRFLPENFWREEFERGTAEPNEQRTRQRTACSSDPQVGPDTISQQLDWLGAGTLRRKALACIAAKTNPAHAQEIFQTVCVKVLPQIQRGQCKATSPVQFNDYVLTICRNECCDIATQGHANGGVLPDLLTRKGLTILADENLTDDFVPARSTPVKSLSDHDERVLPR